MTQPFKAFRDVIIRTPDFDSAVRFYKTVMGFLVAHRGESIVGFEAGAFRLYVERGPAHGPVFDFRVPDFETAKRNLLSAGCTIIEENPAVPRCYIQDPHGLVFNIEKNTP
jgi:catechol 2,3-dioxygenase-like lactoylglutathione lyase family enzyme